MNQQLRKLLKSGSKSPRSNKKKENVSEIGHFECDLTSTGDSNSFSFGLTRSQKAVFDHAEGAPHSERGARRLVNLATEAIRLIEKLCKEGNPHIREIAKNRIDWPVLTAHHSAIQQKNAQLIESIELSKDILTQKLLKQLPARATPAREQTLHLLLLVVQIQHAAVWGESIDEDLARCDDNFLSLLRSRLPQDYTPTLFEKVKLTWPLVLRIKQLPNLSPNKTELGQWQKVTLDLLSVNCNDDPASIPELCALGEHRRFQPLTKAEIAEMELVAGVDYPDFPLEKQNGRISTEIRSILCEEIKKLARILSKLCPGVK